MQIKLIFADPLGRAIAILCLLDQEYPLRDLLEPRGFCFLAREPIYKSQQKEIT